MRGVLVGVGAITRVMRGVVHSTSRHGGSLPQRLELVEHLRRFACLHLDGHLCKRA